MLPSKGYDSSVKVYWYGRCPNSTALEQEPIGDVVSVLKIKFGTHKGFNVQTGRCPFCC